MKLGIWLELGSWTVQVLSNRFNEELRIPSSKLLILHKYNNNGWHIARGNVFHRSNGVVPLCHIPMNHFCFQPCESRRLCWTLYAACVDSQQVRSVRDVSWFITVAENTRRSIGRSTRTNVDPCRWEICMKYLTHLILNAYKCKLSSLYVQGHKW